MPKPVAIVQSPSTGEPIELYRRDDCKAIAVEMGLMRAPAPTGDFDDPNETPEQAEARRREEKAAQRKERVESLVANLAIADLVKRVKKSGARDELVRWLIADELDLAPEAADDALELLGLEPSKEDFDANGKRFAAMVQKAKGNELLSLFVALRLSARAYRKVGFEKVLRASRVDITGLRRKVAADLKLKEKADAAAQEPEDPVAADEPTEDQEEAAEPATEPKAKGKSKKKKSKKAKGSKKAKTPAATEDLTALCANCGDEMGQHATKGMKCRKGGGRFLETAPVPETVEA
jgi:hypothetical protein